MPQTLTQENLNQAKYLLDKAKASNSISELNKFYKYFSDRGYNYPNLAMGITGHSVTFNGGVALEYMRNHAKQQGKYMSKDDIEKVMFNMAQGYLDAMQKIMERNHSINKDLNGMQTWRFHNQAFTSKETNYGKDAWTLHGLFTTLYQIGGEDLVNKRFDEIIKNPSGLKSIASSMANLYIDKLDFGKLTPSQARSFMNWEFKVLKATPDATQSITPIDLVTLYAVVDYGLINGLISVAEVANKLKEISKNLTNEAKEAFDEVFDSKFMKKINSYLSSSNSNIEVNEVEQQNILANNNFIDENNKQLTSKELFEQQHQIALRQAMESNQPSAINRSIS